MRFLFAASAILCVLHVPALSEPAPHQNQPRLAITAESALTAAFGRAVPVSVTIKNVGDDAISLIPARLHLEVKQWGSEGASSSSPDMVAPLTLTAGRSEPVALPGGESVTLYGSVEGVTTLYWGHVRVVLKLVSDDPPLGSIIPKDLELTVEFELVPSAIMLQVWSAKTPDERAHAQQAVNKLLKSGSDMDLRVIGYFGSYGIPYLETAFQHADGSVRATALEALGTGMAWDRFNNLIKGQLWGECSRYAAGLIPVDVAAVEKTCARLSLAGLTDAEPAVRAIAVQNLAYYGDKDTPAAVRKLANDPDPSVRAAVQNYLVRFPDEPGTTDIMAAGVPDSDEAVRKQAVAALEHSHKPPEITSLVRALRSAKGDLAVRLIALVFEQEDAPIAANLIQGFKERSVPERVAILTAIAGHIDDTSRRLVSQGLADPALDVQRAALMRLLAFPAETAIPMISPYAATAPDSLRELAIHCQGEIRDRTLFPFLANGYAGRVAAAEEVFPSKNGTVPMVSPDGQWLAYVETGWGRPGGIGLGRSNLLSIVHVSRPDGSNDHIVSDMFLVGWLSDSKHIASSRDGFATISDLNAKVTAEFGNQLETTTGGKMFSFPGQDENEWPNGEIRQQFGSEMPHTRRLELKDEPMVEDWGEDAAFSPDGLWFGPMKSAEQGTVFIRATGKKIQIKLPAGVEITGWNQQATWSPDGSRIALLGAAESAALVIDFAARAATLVQGVEGTPDIESWKFRKARWNPWSKDGRQLAIIRNGQIWTMAPDGSAARQLTFDSTKKAFPTFSPDGKRIAYVAYQFDDRGLNGITVLGPTDLWVVDVETTLAARLTLPNPHRIQSLDWLDDDTVIFDREDIAGFPPRSSLRRVSIR